MSSGVSVRRAPSARTGGARASLDFSASRTSLAVSTEILKAGGAPWGRGRGASVGEGSGDGNGSAHGSNGHPRVGKQLSLGFTQLSRSVGPEVGEEGGTPRGGRCGALGLGRAFGLRDREREKMKEIEKEVEGGERTRRRSMEAPARTGRNSRKRTG